MRRSLTAVAPLLVWAAACFAVPAASHAQSLPSIRKVEVLRTPNLVEIEIEASDRVVPQTNVLSNPDRLVVDFVNAVPGASLHNKAVNREEVKSLRVGLFSSNPPVTRIVLDLNGQQPYQVFPSGRTVIVKVGAGSGAEAAGYRHSSGPVLVETNYSTQGAHLSVPIPPAPVARPPLEVSFHEGMLSIFSNKATLSEVLFAVHQRTGAEIAIPSGAEQEMVAADLGPAPAAEVLAQLLNGSNFNFLILNSSTNPSALDQVILTPRAQGAVSAPRPQLQPLDAADDDSDAQSRVAPPVRATPPSGNPNPADREGQPAAPETKPASENDPPD
jgi:AMIN domain-containing protein